MSEFIIKVQSKEDAAAGKRNFPEVGARAKKVYVLPVEKVSIIEGMTRFGRAGIAFIAESTDGVAVELQFTNEQLQKVAEIAKEQQMFFDAKR
jgi:hypothetical protein